MNWAFVNNETWDYPADVIGYDTGLAVELNQPKWTFALRVARRCRVCRTWFYRGGPVPHLTPSGTVRAESLPLSRGWAMVTEFERRYAVNAHPGEIRFLGYTNRANMIGYSAAIADSAKGQRRARRERVPRRVFAYRYKYGFWVRTGSRRLRRTSAYFRDWAGMTDRKRRGCSPKRGLHGYPEAVRVMGEAWRRSSLHWLWQRPRDERHLARGAGIF